MEGRRRMLKHSRSCGAKVFSQTLVCSCTGEKKDFGEKHIFIKAINAFGMAKRSHCVCACSGRLPGRDERPTFGSTPLKISLYARGYLWVFAFGAYPALCCVSLFYSPYFYLLKQDDVDGDELHSRGNEETRESVA